MNLPEDKTAAVTAEEAKDAASILVSWCPADRQGPFDVVMRYIEQTSRATRLAAAPKGWKPTETAPKNGETELLLYWAGPSGDHLYEIGRAGEEHWLHGMATHWMPLPPAPDAAPAASSPEVADERATVEVRFDFECMTALEGFDRIYADYATTFGRYPDAFMARVVAQVKEDLFMWWGWHRDRIRAALAGEPAVAAADEGRDAARYRWLRDVGDATWRPFGIRAGYSAAQADAAIDAAMAASQDEQQEKQG